MKKISIILLIISIYSCLSGPESPNDGIQKCHLFVASIINKEEIVFKRYYNPSDSNDKILEEYIYLKNANAIDFEKSFFLNPITTCDTIYTSKNEINFNMKGYFQNMDSCEIFVNESNRELYKGKSLSNSIIFSVKPLKTGVNNIHFEIHPFFRLDSLKSLVKRYIRFDKVIIVE